MPDPSVRAVSQVIGGLVAPKPTGTADGDFIVVVAEIFATVLPSPPAGGWTSEGSGGTLGSRLAVFTKVASGEPSSWTFTSTDPVNTILYTYAVQNAPAGVLDGFNIQSNNTPSTSAPSGSITTTVNGALLIWGAIGLTTLTQPAGMTKDLDGDGGDAIAASVTQTTAGAVSKTGSCGSSTDTVVLLLAVKAGAAPPVTFVPRNTYMASMLTQ